jgi:DNA-binding NarL/FixJ family response regulator
VVLLRSASRLAERRGATGILTTALAELERRGHQGVPSTGGVALLSRVDRRILELAASGIEPHEIAQRLFVTPGTVHAVLDEAGHGTVIGSGISQVGRATMAFDEDRRLP